MPVRFLHVPFFGYRKESWYHKYNQLTNIQTYAIANLNYLQEFSILNDGSMIFEAIEVVRKESRLFWVWPFLNQIKHFKFICKV